MTVKKSHSPFFLLLLVTLLAAGPMFLNAQFTSLSTGTRGFKGHRFQGNGGMFVPNWTDTLAMGSRLDTNTVFQAPMFEGAMFDEQVRNLPFYTVKVPLRANEEIYSVSSVAQNPTETESGFYYLSTKEANLQTTSDWYPAAHVMKGERVIHQKKHYQLVHIYPKRVDRSGRRVQTADRIDYTFAKRSLPVQKTGGANKTIADNSVLASGQWYKIGVTRSGVYKMDYNYLSNLGINLSGVDPRTIKVYGNGGGMLPQVIGAHPHDDLVENSIVVSGEGDGDFGQGDYVLFYGDSPHQWDWLENENRFKHRLNLYSDTTWYFLTFNQGNGLRVPVIASESATNHTPSYTPKVAFYENDLYNPLLSGRSWLGENFDLVTERSFSFSTPNLAPGSNVSLIYRLAARSTQSSSFAIAENGNQIGTVSIPNISTNYGSIYYRSKWALIDIPESQINDGSVDIDLEYTKSTSSGVGYLDFLEVHYKQRLRVGGESIWFFNAVENVGPGQVYNYSISGGNNTYKIWDITDPTAVREQAFTLNGTNMTFGVRADSIKHFVAHTASGHRAPDVGFQVANQNLHSIGPTDFLIVTHPEFLEQAYRLRDFHRNELNQTTQVVDINQIYNEFSSGAQDPTAIRDFVNMFYVRAGSDYNLMPKYLLLFGDGTYDYKKRVSTTGNFIPTYQSRNSYDPPNSYTSDDFFGIQDDGEGFWGERAELEAGFQDILYPFDSTLQTQHIDVAVGRFPVNTLDEARIFVDKVIDYATSPETFGPWKNKIILSADFKPGEYQHTNQANSYTSSINNANPCMNIDKIYLDNYQIVNTADGYRFPEGKAELMKRLNEGSLIVNYTGHGGETGWSNAKILEIPDIKSLKNEHRYQAYITATCEFGRWDDPGRVAGAEHLFLMEKAGCIAMYTTVRVVYSTPNTALNRNFYKYSLSRDTVLNRWHTMGEINMKTKNDTWPDGRINTRNFTLLGDPALTLAYPEHEAVVTKINGATVQNGVIDSLASLTKVSVEGEVRDADGNFLPNFNGDINITVFDKPSKFVTKTFGIAFSWQKNKIFNGLASVTNGKFSFDFVVPLDVSYEEGNAKISLYLNNLETDGAGCHLDLYVGGTDSAAIVDDMGPDISLFMNDEKFAEGQMVGPDPLMIANVFDENGINTVGTGIGHELAAVLDNNEKDVILLNDYYTAKRDNYREGTIEYPFESLSEGEHTLSVKVWDVANNSAESEIRFVVSQDATIALGHVLNYPNPFTTNTKFILEHNSHGALLDCTIKIFTVSGRMVKSLESTFFAEGNLYCDLEWDGLDEWGDAIGRGVYVYQVTLKDKDTGESVSKIEKLVLLR